MPRSCDSFNIWIQTALEAVPIRHEMFDVSKQLTDEALFRNHSNRKIVQILGDVSFQCVTAETLIMLYPTSRDVGRPKK